jgi:hypothetical protein
MNNLIGILGYGEIGSSLEKCYLGTKYIVKSKDLTFDEGIVNSYILHICIPYSDTFIETVVKEIKLNNPTAVFIHSTVIPGTSKKIYEQVNIPIVYTPVRGVHPNLYQGIKTFIKYFSVLGEFDPYTHFKELDIKSESYANTESLELAKLLCTTYYGLAIAWHGEVNKICNKFNLSFEDVSTRWNSTYNDGYTKLGMSNVVRPVLYPPKNNKIGGHCVIPNTELLKIVSNFDLLDSILKYK